MKQLTMIVALLFAGIATADDHLDPATLLASDSIVSTLPKENLSFDIVNNHTHEELVKDQFETSEEFNKRKQKISAAKPISIYINEVLYYDADKEEYSFRCYEGYNEGYATKLLRDETNLIPRSGQNAFGAEWNWNEKVGRIYELRYKCPENHSIQVPLVDAKEFSDAFIAVIELELTAQNWSSKTNYESAEFGKRIVNNYSTNFKNSNITAIHFGHKSSSLLYKKITNTVSDQPPNNTVSDQPPNKAIYDRSCGFCHTSGAAGAPKTGDAAAWESRMALGMDAMVLSVKNGKGAMPPRGMCMGCTDEQFADLITYMAKAK